MNQYLAMAIAANSPDDNSVRTGRVVSLDGTTLSVEINGSVAPCGYLATWTPEVGQTVALIRQGADWLVIGPTAGPATVADPPSLISETVVATQDRNVVGTAYVDDPFLKVQVPATGWFGIELSLSWVSGSAALNTRFTYPANAIGYNGSFFYDAGATPDFQSLPATTSPGIAVGGFPTTGSGNGGIVPLILRGSLLMGGNAGTLQWQRAQNTAVGSTTIKVGSYLKVWRMNYRQEG